MSLNRKGCSDISRQLIFLLFPLWIGNSFIFIFSRCCYIFLFFKCYWRLFSLGQCRWFWYAWFWIQACWDRHFFAEINRIKPMKSEKGENYDIIRY